VINGSRFALLVLALTLVASPATANDRYMTPPPELAKLVDAPLTPFVSDSPDGRMLLLMERSSLPPLSELAEPELRIAGLRINPRNNGPSRTRTMNGLRLLEVSDSSERVVSGLPDSPRIRNVSWSPDGAHVAFTSDTHDRVELWILSVADAAAKRVGNVALNDATRGAPFSWIGNDGLVAVVAASTRGEKPVEPLVPSSPIIQENKGKEAPARTYQDLLKSPHDESLFDYYATSDLVRISLDGSIERLGPSGVIISAEPSPDGRFVLVQTIHRPYSYLVPYYRFPRRLDVIDREGRLVKSIDDLPLHESVPLGFGSVPTGIRSIDWREDRPATLYWVEALDGGNARKDAKERDRVFMLDAPFDGEPVTLITLSLRFGDVTWTNQNTALVSEWWWTSRKERVYLVDLSKPGTGRVIIDRSSEDRYNDPGRPMTEINKWGRSVAIVDKGRLFMSGDGASPEGDRPFVRTFDLKAGATKELFRSTAPHYERAFGFLDGKRNVLLTRRESNDEPPNYFARDLRRGKVRRLTSFPHPYPELKGIQKELIRYEREDGVTLTATLYLPAGYDPKKDGPLPTLVWAYPNEYKSADAAGQVQDSPYRFKSVSYWGSIAYVTRGYAIMDDAAMPVVGEGDAEPNDTFVRQLVMNAKAVIDEGARRGVVDPNRVAVGGHSYGAFMTANLLAHSDLFRTGVARSGAYNRSLTPFGFQAEERTYWEAPEVYFTMSPFMNADKINEPILMIHGQADNNSGTFPLQSERLYSALKGLGKTARLVMLPHESHGYQAYESVMHMLWETDRWLEEYVKNAEVVEEGR
jgi:dipeptidyl aminopeptidase/acylaminoacyl peptidase